MTARPAVSALVTASLAPLLKAAGFRKQALLFERRRGDILQVVNAQVSHGGAAFYINVGLISDAVAALKARSSLSMIGKHAVHYGKRLEQLVPELPASWSPDDPTAGTRIAAALARVVTLFDPIDSASTMLEALDLSRGFDKTLRAQLRWITGDRAGARADLEAVAAEFADRDLSVDQLALAAGLTSPSSQTDRTP